jgi:hypothetical protein
MFTGSQSWELLPHVHMTHKPLRGSRYIGCPNLSTYVIIVYILHGREGKIAPTQTITQLS